MAFKCVTIPGPIMVANTLYTQKELITHYLDNARVFQTLSNARKGFKILDALDTALKGEKAAYVLSMEEWSLLRDVIEDPSTALPVWHHRTVGADGAVSLVPVAVGAFQYLPLIEPIVQATDVEA